MEAFKQPKKTKKAKKVHTRLTVTRMESGPSVAERVHDMSGQTDHTRIDAGIESNILEAVQDLASTYGNASSASRATDAEVVITDVAFTGVASIKFDNTIVASPFFDSADIANTDIVNTDIVSMDLASTDNASLAIVSTDFASFDAASVDIPCTKHITTDVATTDLTNADFENHFANMSLRETTQSNNETELADMNPVQLPIAESIHCNDVQLEMALGQCLGKSAETAMKVLETNAMPTVERSTMAAIKQAVEPTAPIFETAVNHGPVPGDSYRGNTTPIPRNQTLSLLGENIDYGFKPYTEDELIKLYENSELTLYPEFEKNFVESQQNPQQFHPLFKLLTAYVRAKQFLAGCDYWVMAQKHKSEELRKNLWIIEKTFITESGECQDGNPVSTTVTSEVAQFSFSSNSQLLQLLASMKDNANEDRVINAYAAETARQSIIDLLSDVCARCLQKNIGDTTESKYTRLLEEQVNSSEVGELRIFIGIFFSFLRKGIRDEQFSEDLKLWLMRSVAILNQFATWYDHMFILNHVLRCPPGLLDWMIQLVQAPDPYPRARGNCRDPYAAHTIAMLAVILRPIQQREKFIEQFTGGDTWVVVNMDSDGEENANYNVTDITEDDLIKLLVQVPLKNLMKAILEIETHQRPSQECSAVLGVVNWSEAKLLELFAFGSYLVLFFRRGLSTYSDSRYKQLAKLLGCFITNTVRHVSDIWEVTRKHPGHTINVNSNDRLQCEYDALFQRAVSAIYSSQKLGVWQFLAILPYHLVSQQQLWKLYFLLHQPYLSETEIRQPTRGSTWEAEIENVKLSQLFEDLVTSVPEVETYYLLSTFASMALNRTHSDRSFTKTVILDLFKIGFVRDATRENFCKIARTLMSNITTQYPIFMSDILANLKDKFELAGHLGLYLFHDLPIRMWKPTCDDLDIISHWLVNRHLLTTENNLARLVLSNLHYGMNERGLALESTVHRQIALMIVRAMSEFGAETSGVTSYGRQPSHVLVFKSWAWDMMSRLRLHFLDINADSLWIAIYNPALMLSSVPELFEDPSLQILSKGVLAGQPIACFVAVMVTSWGHSIPQICKKGFYQLELLLRQNRHHAVIAALLHIVPLFLESPDDLLKCDKFTSILIGLVTIDKTYTHVAKNLMSAEFPGSVLRQLGNMITHQLENYIKHDIANQRTLVQLWLNSLAQIPNWINQPSVIFLMDIVLSFAFSIPHAQLEAKRLFGKIHNCKEGRKEGGAISSFMNWISSTSFGVSLMQSKSLPYAPWFAAMALDIEEEDTKFWMVLCRILKDDSVPEYCNVDVAIRRTASSLEVPVPATLSLPIYRWAQQAIDTPLEHPLVFYFWQRFFTLYLCRVMEVGNVAGASQGSVGKRFFEYGSYGGLLKRVKLRLQETRDYMANRHKDAELEYLNLFSGGCTDERESVEQQFHAEAKKRFYHSLESLFKTYLLWLDDQRLQDPDFILHTLPVSYNYPKLSLIVTQTKDMWTEFVNLSAIDYSHHNALENWGRSNLRTNASTARKDIGPSKEVNPELSLINRLKVYDDPMTFPHVDLSFAAQPCSMLHTYKKDLLTLLAKQSTAAKENPQRNKSSGFEISNYPAPSSDVVHEKLRANLFKTLNEAAQSLNSSAQAYLLRLSEHIALDCTLLELVPLLYRNTQREIVKQGVCSSSPTYSPILSRPQHVTCAGAATIRIMVSEAVLDSVVEHQIELNRNDYDQVLKNCLQPLPTETSLSAATIQKFVRFFIDEYEQSKSARDSRGSILYRRLGVDCFYHLISLFEEDMAFYPPSSEVFTQSLESLAQVFIYGDGSQTMRFLTTLLTEDRLIGMLSPFFSPSDAPCYKFLEMYNYIVENIANLRLESCFVILTKFDLQRWLSTFIPTLNHRSTLIGYTGKALINAGPTPLNSELIVQEIFRKHLVILLQYSFPEHFGEVLNLLLKGTESQRISLDIWFDFLNSLMGSKCVFRGTSTANLRDDIRLFATDQKQLSYTELVATARLLAKYFNDERLMYGLYGLYPKYRMYIDPLTTFMGMIGHCLVVATLQQDTGSLTDMLCTILWPALQSMYAPWIVPFITGQLEEPTASWIEQLSDDRSVLSPWIQVDDPHATKVVVAFIESIRFILDTLPGCSNILHYLWEFYVLNFANPSVKEHVLSVMHHHLSGLPWHQFCPTIEDMEYMFKVLNQFLPGSHAFLGGIFTEVPWTVWVVNIINNLHIDGATKAHIFLLNLLVKLANEPSVRQKCKVQAILVNSQKFAWHLVDSVAYGQVLDWWISSSDPRVVLALGEAYTNPIDAEVLALLRIVAHFTSDAQMVHPTKLHKRMMYIRACMKMLVQTTTKYKSLIASNKASYHTCIRKLLDGVESTVLQYNAGPMQVGECAMLLKELLVYGNQFEGNLLAPILTESSAQWIAGRDAHSLVLSGFLKALGSDVTSAITFGALLEVTLNSYFKCTVSQVSVPTWSSVVNTLTDPLITSVEESLIVNGQILSLHAIVFKSLHSAAPKDSVYDANMLARLIEWLKVIKPTEVIEAKLPLLWGLVLSLIKRQYQLNVNELLTLRSVRVMIQLLTSLSEDKGAGWGILGAIGIRKHSPVSIKCRMLSRAIAVYLMAQLTEGTSGAITARTSADAPTISTSFDGRSQVPCSDAIRSLRELEALTANKQYQEVKTSIETAVILIKDGKNTILTAPSVLGILANELYSQQFLLVLNG